VISLFKWTLIFFLLLPTLSLNKSYAKVPQTSTENRIPFKKEEMDLLHYMNKILMNAGISDEARSYLVEMSRPRLSKVDKNDFQEKKGLLKRNLYILLIDLGSRKPLLLNEDKMLYSTQVHEMVSKQFLSAEHLSFLRSNQVFNELSVKDIKVIFKLLCPMWPWC